MPKVEYIVNFRCVSKFYPNSNLNRFSVHLGKLKKEDALVSVRVYNPDSGVELGSQEVAKLR